MLSEIDAPSPKGDGIPFVRRVAAEETCRCELHSAQPTWIFTHYNETNRRTTYCKAERDRSGYVVDDSHCEECKRRSLEREKGYLFIWNQGDSRHEFLEITPTAWQSMQDKVGSLADLTGYRLHLTRGKGKKARFTVSVYAPQAGFVMGKPPTLELLERALRKLMRM